MALSDLTFTNNLGSITLTRVMYSISHALVWDGENPAKPGVEISAKGSLQGTEADMNSVTGSGGLPGTLVLPHAVLPGMRIREMTYDEGFWSPWGSVSVTFSDSDESSSVDTSVEFRAPGGKSVTIYTPVIVFYPSIIRRGDSRIYGLNGWVRQQTGHEPIKISVSGDIATTPCTTPDDILEIMEQKTERIEDMPEQEYDKIKNYPRVGSLSSFIPAAANNYDLRHVMIVDGRVEWDYENNVADVEIQMLAPPQKIIVEEEE